MRKVFFNSRGLRAGWRLLIFIAIFAALSFASDWIITKVFHPQQRPFLDPISFLDAETVSLILALIATWIMARIERRSFRAYGIPPLRNAFGRQFWIGTVWGIVSTSALIGLIAAFGGYRVLGLAIRGRELWYFTAIWLIANLLIGFAEELQFRAYLLATALDRWPSRLASTPLSTSQTSLCGPGRTRANTRLVIWAARTIYVSHPAPQWKRSLPSVHVA